MDMKRTHHSRKFLNPKKGIALIETTGRMGVDWVDASATICDCNRRIDLDFSFNNKKQRKERIAKLELLIAELGGLLEFMIENDDVPKS